MAEWLDKVINKFGATITFISWSFSRMSCCFGICFTTILQIIKNLIFVAGSYEIPVNKDLIDLALDGNMESLNLMMKWGYGSSKQFIGETITENIEFTKRSKRSFSGRFNCL